VRKKKQERKKDRKYSTKIQWPVLLHRVAINNVKNRGMRVNMNKAKVMISGERQKPVQKAARWPRGV